MVGDGITIRGARRSDAREIAAMANELNLLDGPGGEAYSPELVLAQGFGAAPLFSVLVAEDGGGLLGYALFHDCYNSEKAAPGLWMVDLYVRAGARRRGIGAGLVAAVAREAVARGARSVWWGVRNENRGARAFYAKLGAKDDGARILELDGAALRGLAGTATRGGETEPPPMPATT